MYCSMPKKEELKLNKLNKISGLSRWEAKATKQTRCSERVGQRHGRKPLGAPPGPLSVL